eukprot:3133493-Pleurochrysis_carterae.AAC.1
MFYPRYPLVFTCAPRTRRLALIMVIEGPGWKPGDSRLSTLCNFCRSSSTEFLREENRLMLDMDSASYTDGDEFQPAR